MADYQEYRRRVLRRRWRRRFMATGLLLLLLMVGAIGMLWKSLHRETSPSGMGQNTILQEVTQDDTWNTVSYAVARPLTVQALAGSTATALDFRMAAVPQSTAVEKSWFNDVSFVGDSLTQGMQLYEEGMQNAMFCAYKGVGPNVIVNGTTCKRADGTTEVPLEALTAQNPRAVYLFFLLFQLHYFQRSFVFPFLLKGKSRMPVAIMAMGIVFNVLNGMMQAGGLFYFAPEGLYAGGWAYLLKPHALPGVLLFFAGMFINLHSDHVIRHLRKPGDTRHYLPAKGLYRYVTSANYFGELVEWTGFAILTASPAAWVFVWWTFANLVPRSDAIYRHYRAEFGDEAVGKRKRIIPYVY